MQLENEKVKLSPYAYDDSMGRKNQCVSQSTLKHVDNLVK